jgi:hypothetical protein
MARTMAKQIESWGNRVHIVEDFQNVMAEFESYDPQLVLFLPLLVAAMHTAFAFPILTRLLRALFAADQMLFLGCTLGALAVFAILYVVIYSLTARTYYKLVRWE